MKLNEILELDKTQASIKKIDLFIGSKAKMTNEYVIAVAYKAIVFHNIGKTNEGLKILFGLVLNIKDMQLDAIIYLCDAIIDICLDVSRYDQVLKYINVKKSFLPVSKNHLHLKDNIKYYLKTNKFDLAKEELKIYIKDDLVKEEYIEACEQLADIYYQEHNYTEFMEIARELESYYQANMNLYALANLGIKKIIVAYEKGNYIRVINEGNIFIKDSSIKARHKIVCATLLIKCYVMSGDYKRACIVESEYEELTSVVDINLALDFCYAALDLYTKTNTLIPKNEYTNKIQSLENRKKENKQVKRKTKKSEEVIIPVINDALDLDVEVEKKNYILNPEPVDTNLNSININYSAIKDVVVSENYNKLSKIFNAISEVDLKSKFREVFRQCCIEISKQFGLEEIYLLYYKRGYHGIHYKKERAYDKRLDFEQLDNTISFASVTYENELFLDPENSIYNKDIITNKEYKTIPYAYSIPLFDNMNAYASISFFSNESFLDKEMVYESLKMISSMINTRLLMSLKQDEIEFNNRKMFFINENMSSGIKEEIDGYLHFSSQACKMLGIYEDVLESEFLNRMKKSEISEYKRIHEEIYTLMTENLVYEYDFKNDQDKWIRIRERYYPMIHDGVICIISLLDDITLEEKDKRDLLNLAFTNPVSKMNTEVKLINDLKNSFDNKKLSLAIIDICDFKYYQDLYGYLFCKQLIAEVGKEFIKSFEEDFYTSVYHLESDRYAVLFNEVNDKRVVDSKLNQAFKYVSKALNRLNNRVNLRFNCGVFRLARHSNMTEPEKIIIYALEALTDAKTLTTIDNHINHFDSELHKLRFKENSIVTHISECIDHGKIGLTYKQIVNLIKNEVYGYNVTINLDNFEIDEDYMNYVINRRSLTSQLEKYMITNVFKELKMLKDTLKGYVLCFVKVSKQTLEERFIEFLETQKNFFKVSNEYITLICEDCNNKIVQKLRNDGYKIASSNLMDVYSNSCDYLLYDYHKVGIESVNEIKELLEKHNIKLIISNMDNKDDILTAREKGFELIYGNYYKKALRMKTLIEKISN